MTHFERRRAKGWSARVVFLSWALGASITSAAHAQEDILTYRGPDRERRIMEGARQEGEVVLYSGLIANQALRPIADGFMKKHPAIKMTFWRAPPEDIMAKIMAERRANNMVGDVLASVGIGELAIEAGVAQPYFTPALEEYPPSHRDPEGRWAPTNLYYYGVAYNTRLVPPEQAPKTYADLLDPKWKGKMAWRVGDFSGAPLFISNLRIAWGEEKAMAYLEKLKGQAVVNFAAGSARTLVDRVMAGEYALALNIYANHPLISAAKGAPVATKLMDPTASSSATMVIPKGGRHPHAALLLADFILSEEGQKILATAEYFPAHPKIPPLNEILAVVPKVAGVPETFVGPDRYITVGTDSEKIYQRLFR